MLLWLQQRLISLGNCAWLALCVGVCWYAWSKPAIADSDIPGQRSVQELRRRGFMPLFNGNSLDAWDVKPQHKGHWTVRDGCIDYDGKAEGKGWKQKYLWSKEAFGDFILYVEWRLPSASKIKQHPIVLYNGDFLRDKDGKRITRPRPDAGDSGILMRGVLKCQANIWCQELGSGEINGYRTDPDMPPEVRRACIPIKRADRPMGEWNVFEITLQGDCITVVLNGEKVIDAAHLPDLPANGPIGLQHHGDPVQFRNIWVKKLQ